MNSSCYMPLANGWTASISSHDIEPAICSVAAWATSQTNAPHVRSADRLWFNFGDGRLEYRCFSLADIREALGQICAAAPIAPSAPSHDGTKAGSEQPGLLTVPLQPTTAMLVAGQTARRNDPLKRSTTLYRAMVEAAPVARRQRPEGSR